MREKIRTLELQGFYLDLLWLEYLELAEIARELYIEGWDLEALTFAIRANQALDLYEYELSKWLWGLSVK